MDSQEGLIPVEEFAKAKGITVERAIEMIKDGFYSGRIVDGLWFAKSDELGTTIRLASSSYNGFTMNDLPRSQKLSLFLVPTLIVFVSTMILLYGLCFGFCGAAIYYLGIFTLVYAVVFGLISLIQSSIKNIKIKKALILNIILGLSLSPFMIQVFYRDIYKSITVVDMATPQMKENTIRFYSSKKYREKYLSKNVKNIGEFIGSKPRHMKYNFGGHSLFCALDADNMRWFWNLGKEENLFRTRWGDRVMGHPNTPADVLREYFEINKKEENIAGNGYKWLRYQGSFLRNANIPIDIILEIQQQTKEKQILVQIQKNQVVHGKESPLGLNVIHCQKQMIKYTNQ
jgi:hypothetical protein